MAIKIIWNGPKIVKKTADQIFINMGLATQFMRNEVKTSINRPQPTRTSSTTGKRRGLNPSKPGEPPKRIEGDLFKSIVTEITRSRNKIVGRYGSTLTEIAIWLEFGTSRIAARPFLRPPLLKNRAELVRILTR